MKKLGIILMILLLLTGCTSYTELNDLSIVSMMAINYQEDEFELTIQLLDGKIENNQVDKQITTLSSKSNTIEGCFHNIYQKSSKRLYLSHIDLLVLTETAINHDLKAIFSHFLNNNEYRNNFKVVLIHDQDVKKITENNTASSINQLLKINHQESGITTQRDFEQILNELLIDSNTYLPTILFHDDEIMLDGYTFINNYQVEKTMTKKESILFNLLNNQIHKTYLNHTHILENETMMKTKKNHITFQFTTTVDHDEDFIDETTDDLKEFLSKYQQENLDILKLKETIRKNNPRYYKQEKNHLLQTLTFDFDFQLKTKKKEQKRNDNNET